MPVLLAALALSAPRLLIRWGVVATAFLVARTAARLMPRAASPSPARENASAVVLVGGGLAAAMLRYGNRPFVSSERHPCVVVTAIRRWL